MYLWAWYWELRPHDRDGLTGTPRAMSYADVFYWQEVTGMRLTDRELRLLRRLDAAYLQLMAEAQERRARSAKHGR